MNEIVVCRMGERKKKGRNVYYVIVASVIIRQDDLISCILSCFAIRNAHICVNHLNIFQLFIYTLYMCVANISLLNEKYHEYEQKFLLK